MVQKHWAYLAEDLNDIISPTHDQLPQLRSLWLASFGDEGGFIDIFFEKGFSIERCRCITIDSQVAAALYWFETECCGQKLLFISMASPLTRSIGDRGFAAAF